MKNKKRILVSLLMMFSLILGISISAYAATAKASIKLNTSKVSVVVGKTTTLTATVTGKSKKVTWKSSNTKVATVKNGVVTAKKAGKVTITAKANGKSKKCVVTVKNVDYAELYRAFLRQSKVKGDGSYTYAPGYFYLLNIDKKGVPELIVSSKYGYGVYHVYTILNGKVTYTGTYSRKGFMIHQISYSSKYKGLYTEGWINHVGGVYSYYYGMNSAGKKLVAKQHMTEYTSPSRKYYYGTTASQSKKVSKSKYLSFYKKYFKGKYKNYSMHVNTEANRIKCIK